MCALTQASLRALNIIKAHPGLSATTFSKLAWPNLIHYPPSVRHVIRPATKAGHYLAWLKRQKLLRRKLSGNPFREPTHAIYYLSDLGYELCENENRARRSRLSRGSTGRPRPFAQ